MKAEFCIRCGSQPPPFGKIKSIMPNGRAVPLLLQPLLRRVDQMQPVSVKPQPRASTHIVTNIVTDTEAIGCASRRLGEGRNSCVMSCLK